MGKRKNSKHGMSGSRLYKIYRGMKQRCNNPNEPAFSNYGGKGVTICQEWDNDFVPFMEWALANGYEEDLTIDRVDSSGNYEPGNCRWLTRAENTRRARLGKKGSKRKSKFYEYKGRTQTLEEWSEELELPYGALYMRLTGKASGMSKWTVEEAFSTPVGGRPNSELITFKGETKTLVKWAKQIGVKPDTLHQRLHRLNWTVERALTKTTRPKAPSKGTPKNPSTIEFNGKNLTVREWAKEIGVSYATLYQRLNKSNMSLERALTKKVKKSS